MIKRINHIGVAVKSVDEAVKLYAEVLGLKVKEIVAVPEQKIKIAVILVGESKIELIEPTSQEGTVAKFIEREGEGLHHLALEVSNIREELEILASKGVMLVDEKPRSGIEGTKVAFLHPKGTRGVLVELVED